MILPMAFALACLAVEPGADRILARRPRGRIPAARRRSPRDRDRAGSRARRGARVSRLRSAPAGRALPSGRRPRPRSAHLRGTSRGSSRRPAVAGGHAQVAARGAHRGAGVQPAARALRRNRVSRRGPARRRRARQPAHGGSLEWRRALRRDAPFRHLGYGDGAGHRSPGSGGGGPPPGLSDRRGAVGRGNARGIPLRRALCAEGRSGRRPLAAPRHPRGFRDSHRPTGAAPGRDARQHGARRCAQRGRPPRVGRPRRNLGRGWRVHLRTESFLREAVSRARRWKRPRLGGRRAGARLEQNHEVPDIDLYVPHSHCAARRRQEEARRAGQVPPGSLCLGSRCALGGGPAGHARRHLAARLPPGRCRARHARQPGGRRSHRGGGRGGFGGIHRHHQDAARLRRHQLAGERAGHSQDRCRAHQPGQHLGQSDSSTARAPPPAAPP